jgi:hypothetical protein
MSSDEYEEYDDEDEIGDYKYREGLMIVPLEEKQHISQVVLRFLQHTDEPTIMPLFRDNQRLSRQVYAENYRQKMAIVHLSNQVELMVDFGPYIDGDYLIKTKAHRSNFNGFPDRHPPSTIEAFLARMTRFVQTWVDICESVHAEFAFHRHSNGTPTNKYIKEFILPDLCPVDPESLLLSVWTYWLTYLGPQLAPQIPDSYLQTQEDMKTTRLPSGALVLRNRFSPLLLENDALDEAFFEQEIDLSHRASE